MKLGIKYYHWYRVLLSMVLLLATTIVNSQDQKPKSILNLTVENDFFFFIDRYYTSGVEISFSNRAIGKSPVSKVLIPSGNESRDYYSMSISHCMFTPEKTLTPIVVYEDRPYASYFLVSSKKSSYNSSKNILINSAISIGMIGAVSGAKDIQNTLHQIIPYASESKGWHHQIKNDLCLMYNASLEKGLLNLPNLEIIGNINATLGVPHTETSIGSYMRIGIFTDYFRGFGFDLTDDFNAWFFCSGSVYLVHYNATLQGGTFNQDNHHTFYEINQTLLHATYGVVVQYKHFNLEYGFEVRSPEFQNGWWHRWGHIELAYAF